MKSNYRRGSRVGKSFKKTRSRKGSTLFNDTADEKLLNITGIAFEKSDFYELDSTVELVQNHEMSQNGKTKMIHKIKYGKNDQVINVVFNVYKEGGIKAADEEDDALIIKFARKTHNSKNIKKLQESKSIAAKIISHNLAD
jgi:hypothetical protein